MGNCKWGQTLMLDEQAWGADGIPVHREGVQSNWSSVKHSGHRTLEIFHFNPGTQCPHGPCFVHIIMLKLVWAFMFQCKKIVMLQHTVHPSQFCAFSLGNSLWKGDIWIWWSGVCKALSIKWMCKSFTGAFTREMWHSWNYSLKINK